MLVFCSCIYLYFLLVFLCFCILTLYWIHRNNNIPHIEMQIWLLFSFLIWILFANLFLWKKGWDALIESMKKARRLNNHVFSMLKARCPLEDKTACAIKQSGAPLHRIKFENTVSAFETLPQKGAWIEKYPSCSTRLFLPFCDSTSSYLHGFGVVVFSNFLW